MKNIRKTIIFSYIFVNIVSRCSGHIKCYKCTVHPPGSYSNETRRLCSQFDESEHYEIDCPYSTFCVRRIFELPLQGGRKVRVEEKGCAEQRDTNHVYKNGKWTSESTIMEKLYKDGCFHSEQLGLKTAKTEYCYCSSNLCNKGESTINKSFIQNIHTMSIILILNIAKFIYSI